MVIEIEREYRTIDKSAWGDGPWLDEPDKLQWTDTDTGLPCLIVRNPGGALCGYVGVSKGHPLYGVDYLHGIKTDIPHECYRSRDEKHSPECILTVHCGITYADACQHGPEDQSVCHVLRPGEPDEVWWLGFDCGHYLDVSPLYEASPIPRPGPPAEYRDIAYVQGECHDLAVQLATISTNAKSPATPDESEATGQ